MDYENLFFDCFNNYINSEQFEKIKFVTIFKFLNKNLIKKLKELYNDIDCCKNLHVYSLIKISNTIDNTLNNYELNENFLISYYEIFQQLNDCYQLIKKSYVFEIKDIKDKYVDEKIKECSNSVYLLEHDISNIKNNKYSSQDFVSGNYNYRFKEREIESKLKKWGYSVAQNSRLTNAERQDKIRRLIVSKELSKGYIVSYLQHMIQINGKKETNNIALKKWKSDLEYVMKL